jgi:hypothetical protein
VDRPHVHLPVLVVELREAGAVALLLAEGAHHAHPRERLLQVGGDRGDLLASEPVGAARRQPERDAPEEQDREGQEGHQGEARVEQDQDRGRADQHERGREERLDALRDELVERLDVVGDARDQHARLVARVEADREPLQVLEQLDAQVLERPLADPVDQVRLEVGGAPVDQRRPDEGGQDLGQDSRVALLDALVDRQAGEVGRHQRRAGGDPQRSQHQQHAAAVGPQQAHEVAQPPVSHRPATSRSGSSRVRKTWSGSPFSAISR